ncbi:iron-sulfur cluster insertion protein ErpA [Buchnera aphidicola]|uniref:Iron-sulfur cluster insertion protein ErpA n=1 Tax=Buchnera aphidicola (Therioaphis trifolii) TaxID=1241884 RepID=A0A4D6YD13_9GAMM|nr:iron-sulfur cluster insertion protein ErpA [Buchnera aphidicola]QCI27149.1 iron-sulfur cluster insertion protein ErpA [Buchnera aphidicola (Therioaphis trifolii)]
MINSINLKIKFTQSANYKILKLIKKNQTLKFRIYIIGGGCNGFQYQFKIDNKINKNDIIIKKNFNIIIDAISLHYINGGIIDYQETLSGSKFIVYNPNAKTTCSCGSSFGI